MPQSPVGHAEQTPVLCAIGIISPPTYTARREAIRQTWLADVPTAIAAKFVVRTGALNKRVLVCIFVGILDASAASPTSADAFSTAGARARTWSARLRRAVHRFLCT